MSWRPDILLIINLRFIAQMDALLTRTLVTKENHAQEVEAYYILSFHISLLPRIRETQPAQYHELLFPLHYLPRAGFVDARVSVSLPDEHMASKLTCS